MRVLIVCLLLTAVTAANIGPNATDTEKGEYDGAMASISEIWDRYLRAHATQTHRELSVRMRMHVNAPARNMLAFIRTRPGLPARPTALRLSAYRMGYRLQHGHYYRP